jgi:predicted ferric reductase
LEGPYGRFDYRSGASEQIWLGAGVGIAPFLSWARHLERSNEQNLRATLYYCVHDHSDAVNFEEFNRIAERVANLDVTLVCSREQGHVRAADLGPLEGKDIFMCGPRRFTTVLKSQLMRRGVPAGGIHYEDFEFR